MKDAEKESPSEFTITNKVLKFKGQMYQLRNLSSIGRHTVLVDSEHKYIGYVLTIVVVALAVFAAMIIEKERSEDLLWPLLIPFVAGVYGIVGVWDLFGKKNVYAVKIVMNSGTVQYFISKDSRWVDKVLTVIEKVLESERTPANINIDMRSNTINGRIGDTNIS